MSYDPKDFQRNKARFAHYAAQYRDGIKAEMVEAYGGSCKHCGESDPLVLALDHIHDDSHVEKEYFNGGSRGGAKLYAELKKQGWPKERFQLLCFNCNAKKEHKRRRDGLVDRMGERKIATSESRSRSHARTGAPRNNASGIKGVFWNNQKSKWQANVMWNYKTKHLGFFSDIRDAAKAYREEAIKIWGDDANVPTDDEIEAVVAMHAKPAIYDEFDPDDLGL